MIPQFSGYCIGRFDFTSSSIHSNYKYPRVFSPQLIKRTYYLLLINLLDILLVLHPPLFCATVSIFRFSSWINLNWDWGKTLWFEKVRVTIYEGRFSMRWETLMDTMHTTTQILLLALINATLSVNLICQIFLSIKAQKWPWTVK